MCSIFLVLTYQQASSSAQQLFVPLPNPPFQCNLLYKSRQKFSCLTFLAGQRSVVSCISVKNDKTGEHRRRLDPQAGSDADRAYQKAAGYPYKRVLDPEHLKALHIMYSGLQNWCSTSGEIIGQLHLSSLRNFALVVLDAVHQCW